MGWGFSVTPDELARIGDRLDEVQEDLRSADENGEGVQAYRDDLGHDGLADITGSFESNWSLKRRELAGDVGRLAGLARYAARSYQDTDDTVGSSFS